MAKENLREIINPICKGEYTVAFCCNCGYKEDCDQVLSAIQAHYKARRLSMREIFNIITEQKTGLRFSERRRVATAIFKVQEKDKD